MPKLDAKTANAVNETDPTHGGDFEPLEDGKYIAKLSKVEARPETNKYDAAQWSAEFEEIHTLDGVRKPGRQWLNLTLPTTDKPHPKYEETPEKWVKYQNMLRGRLSAFFAAFGYTSDSDTDEMLGEWAIITLGHETVQQGANAGKVRNRTTDINEVPEDFEPPADEADEVKF